MSLFGNNQYQYRETYFVLFSGDNLPTAEDLQSVLGSLAADEAINVVQNESGFNR